MIIERFSSKGPFLSVGFLVRLKLRVLLVTGPL